MVRILCRAIDCIFWEDNLCSSEEITYDPDEGCTTYEVIDDVLPIDDGDDWEDDDEDDDEDFEAVGFYYEGGDDEDLDLFDDDDDDDDW